MGLCLAASLMGSLVFALPTCAQIIPDSTLTPNNSQVPSQAEILPQVLITGGSRPNQGSSLFHSFQDFQVGANQQVIFDDPAGVTDIFARITGSQASQVLGTLGVNGNANLFLLNPNGILFGPQAQLNLKGAFVATSAQSLLFANGSSFSADRPSTAPLLTIAMPIGLTFGNSPAPIRVEGSQGLNVGADRSLVLAGGDVLFSNAQVRSPDSHLQFGGLAGAGTLTLSPDPQRSFKLSVSPGLTPSNVTFQQGSMLNVQGTGIGDLEVQSQNLVVSQSNVLAGVAPGIGFSQTAGGGEIRFNATGTITLNQISQVANSVLPGAIGNTGGIEIVARSLQVLDGSTLDASSFGQGNVGAIRIQATDAVTLAGAGESRFLALSRPSISASAIRHRVEVGAVGNGAGISIDTNTLSLRDGAILDASLGGQGVISPINIQAGTVTFAGNNNVGVGAVMSNDVEPTARGQVTGIRLNADRLVLRDGSALSSVTFGSIPGAPLTLNVSDEILLEGENRENLPSLITTDTFLGTGNAGSLTLNTGRLILRDGAGVTTATLAGGNAGDINIHAKQQVVVEGENADQTLFAVGVPLSVVFGTAVAEGAPSGIVAGVAPITQNGSTGGTITVTTPELIIRDGGLISSQTFGSGSAGDIQIQADRILLEGNPDRRYTTGIFATADSTAPGGSIAITTQVLRVINKAAIQVSNPINGPAGNLTITANQVLLDRGILSAETAQSLPDRDSAVIRLQDLSLLALNNGSTISASAFQAANGGNITIDAGFLVGLRSQATNGVRNNIIANAFQGNGGNIQISTQNILGSQLLTIQASSQLGIDGTVAITAPELNPGAGLAALPSNLIDLSRLINQDLCHDRASRTSSFTTPGRGGLAPSPAEALNLNVNWEDLTGLQLAPPSPPARTQDSSVNSPVPEAQGWFQTAHGEIVLTTQDPFSHTHFATTCSLAPRTR
jgi:filamentous hemagglutinin family protein